MKKERSLKFLIYFITLLCSICLFIFGYFLIKLNVLPLKYMISLFVGIFIILIGVTYFTYKRKSLIVKTLGLGIILMLSGLFMYATTYLNNTYRFLIGMQVGEYETLSFNIFTLNDNSYMKLEDLEGKKIGYLELEYDFSENLKEKINYEGIEVLDFGTLLDMLKNKEVEAIVLGDEYWNLIKEEEKEIDSIIRKIGDFEVLIKEDNTNNEINIVDKPFILYISGIDQYGNVNSIRGRSDVNQLVVVNPNTHKILLVNTPRDYYVRLHGTTGLKDKLTHAGIYGIDKSIETLEDLYDIDINYYIRVNFNSLIKLVEAIGGIDVYSDKAFHPLTRKSVYIEKGWNHFNGEQALAYARERYAYKTGDRHRGENQQQVITAIIDKVTSSNILISKYNSILNSLEGSFQTDMDMDTITSFIRYQIKEMPSWEVNSVAVLGRDSHNYTYSMGKKYLLYVMEPDMDSVKSVQEQINEVLNES